MLVDPPEHREIFHGYSDALDPPLRTACYSVNEVLAEKTRALYERQGRARDVYDLVHISRNFREDISAQAAARIAAEKFAFKGIDLPTPQQIVDAIDKDALQTNWDQQLRHQLPSLPNLSGFTDELLDAIAWWMQPDVARPAPSPLPSKPEEDVLPRVHFRRQRIVGGIAPSWFPDEIRFAARNRLLVQFSYHGSERKVEPYSLRRKRTGNVLLYGHELARGGIATDQIKSYKAQEIIRAQVLDVSFSPRWRVEL